MGIICHFKIEKAWLHLRWPTRWFQQVEIGGMYNHLGVGHQGCAKHRRPHQTRDCRTQRTISGIPFVIRKHNIRTTRGGSYRARRVRYNVMLSRLLYLCFLVDDRLYMTSSHCMTDRLDGIFFTNVTSNTCLYIRSTLLGSQSLMVWFDETAVWLWSGESTFSTD